LASFREAVRQGADIIELDVQLSRDGHVVVFHDDRLERTSNSEGPLADRSLAELRSLDAGIWFAPRFEGELIPTLEEVLAWAKDRVPLFIELKYGESPDPGLESAVVEQVLHHQMTEQVMIISFEHQALYRVKERVPQLATGALYREPVADPVELARSIGSDAIAPLWSLISAEGIDLCHRAGLAVDVWGPAADYAALIAAGADCMTVDHPAQIRQDYF
jgi:glycerophosphoryl diester phosphodiesterase